MDTQERIKNSLEGYYNSLSIINGLALDISLLPEDHPARQPLQERIDNGLHSADFQKAALKDKFDVDVLNARDSITTSPNFSTSE